MTSPSTDAWQINDLRHLEERCTWLRTTILDMAHSAGSGHLGPTFSCVEILVALYYGYMRIDPRNPGWDDRDRFVMGKGHACSALYPVLADLGFFPAAELDTFTQLGSMLADHPNMTKNPGVDFSSGSLGHGLSIGAGMTEAARLKRSDERIIIMLGDGELNEGQIWEAAAYASSRKLGGLLAIVDQNHVQVDGTTTEVLDFGDVAARFGSFGWVAETVDGHDLRALRAALGRYDARRQDPASPPTVIVADTVAGKGVSFIEGMAEWHVGFLAGTDYDRARSEIQAMYKENA